MMVSDWLQFYNGVRLTPVLQWYQTDSSFTVVSDLLLCYDVQLIPVLWSPADPSVMMVSVWLQCHDVQLIPVLWWCQSDSSVMMSSWSQCYDGVSLTPVSWCPADPSVMMSSWSQCCDVQLIPVLWWCADRTAADEPPDALPEEGVAHQGTEHCTGVHHLPGTCPSLSLLHIPCLPFLSLTLGVITYLGLIMKILIRWRYLHRTKLCLEGLFQAHTHTHTGSVVI